ncbi:MAG: HlyD family efflux transporter periplasmic adaptor subunit [Massilia sp.]
MTDKDINLGSIAALLQIEQDARQASNEAAVHFIAVNDTWRIVPYRQALLWKDDALGRPALHLVSGLADLAGDSPYRQWINDSLRHLVPGLVHGKVRTITQADLPTALHPGWQEWMGPSVLLVTLPAPGGASMGGLWLTLDHEASTAETALLERLAGCYGQAMWAWRQREPLWQSALTWTKTRRKRWMVAALLVACIPMRLTVLAPAHIIGKDAKLIAAPQDGVVARFFVAPNQAVAAGAPLFALDDTGARNRNAVAVRSRDVAAAEYLRTTQKAFNDGDSKAELSSLQARLEEKTAEAHYVQDLYERVQVSAPAAGIAIFSDPNDWLGRPVQTGERIVLLADPAKVQIAIDLPVEDALNMAPGTAVKLYLNVAPLGAVEGSLSQSSYEPTLTPEGIVAYQLKADLAPGQTVPRIGLKGTAKIYGDWAPLIYHVLRKPLAVLRRSVGL